jgi:hypothetical protein
MKNWPWNKILVGVAFLLIVVGIVPRARLFFWSKSHNLFPLTMPLPLKSGEYASLSFKTDLRDTYEIDLSTVDYPAKEAQVDLNWKVVDDAGTTIEQGAFEGRIDSGPMKIGQYKPKLGQRQRVIVRINRDVQGTEAVHPQLQIGLPQKNSDLCDAIDILNAWAFVMAGSGAALLLFLLILRMRRSKNPMDATAS